MIRKTTPIFRFEELDMWKEGIRITKPLLLIANNLENKHLYRFAEQLRAAVMSITNNIAEGSASFSNKEFAQFLNISRRSLFECFNILVILNDSNIIEDDILIKQKEELDHLSRKITNFRKTLIIK